MREIKFRGKLINKYAEEWFYGDLIQVKDGTVDKKENPVIDYYIITDDYSFKDNKIELKTCQSPKIDANTIGQYTGLKDKTGVEIYEGDIVNCYDRNFIVEFRKERGGFFPFACGDGCGCCEDEVISSYGLETSAKVIGNIYDNPEL